MSWMDAAKRYARVSPQCAVRANEMDHIVATALIITSFANSRVGLEARVLLEVSQKMIACGSDSEYSYFFGPQGPVRVANNAPFMIRRPVVSPVYDIAKALVRAVKSSEHVMPYFRAEIDKIAKAAPNPFAE